MTKGELIDAVKGDLSKKLTTEIVDSMFAAIKAALIKEKRFVYPGFGTFVVKKMGKNPRNGKAIKIPESRTVSFRPAAKLKETL